MRSRTLTLLFATTFPVLLSACDDTTQSEQDVADLQELIDDTTLDVADDADDTPQVTCGDGVLHPDEGCDDGNTADGDGCSATCVIETSAQVCRDEGASCDPTQEQPLSLICVDEGDGTGLCARRCQGFSECDPGDFCTVDGVCVESECDGFFDDSACGADEKCIPAGYAAYTCERNGSGAPGESCMADADCGDRLLCIRGVCTAPDCNPETGAPGCMDDGVCEGASIDGFTWDFGFCITQCVIFVDETCPEGAWCFPDVRDPETGQLVGRCVERPQAFTPYDESCDPPSPPCQAGSVCIVSETEGRCRKICDPQDPKGETGCEDGLACGSLVGSDGELLDWGACLRESCTPYVDDSMSGCEATTEWCFPSQTQAGVGQCILKGEGAVMEAGLCGDDYDGNGNIDAYETCAAGLFCQGFSATEARCVLPCDPEATPADPGHCANVSSHADCTCVESSDGVAFGFVSTTETCTYEHGGARVECTSQGTCVPGELFGDTEDVCAPVPTPALDELDNCTDAGLAEGDICSTNGICLILNQLGGPEVLCYELCTTAEGAFGTSMHPDCSRGTAVCTQRFMSTEFGLCAEDTM